MKTKSKTTLSRAKPKKQILLFKLAGNEFPDYKTL
jgi:hypothetical protein